MSTTVQNFPIRTINVTLPQGQYYFRIVSNANILSSKASVQVSPGTSTSSGGTGGTSYRPPTTGVTAGSTTITYTGETTKTLRRTYESPVLPHARYEIRVRKTNTPVDDKHIQDTYLVDVSEILNSKVTISSLATGWYAIKMTDQISGIPTITWPVQGVKVDIYDNNGTVTSTAFSNNPADIVLDMLIGERRGALKDKISIDFPAYVKWREQCVTDGLTFNGVFDTMTTLWDALSQVYRVGRAYPVRVGSKLSVAMDAATQPVMMFGPGNIYKDSFQISYLPLADRANSFEVGYYDKDDLNKKKTLRITDPTAAQAGEVEKVAQFDLIGVDNFTQAQKEVWYQLYQNRLARRVITFDAPVESIAMTIGDVALVQHDMVNWGTAGRLKGPNTTNTVVLDKNVTIEAGKTYSILVVQDKVSKMTCSFTHVSGTTYSLTALSTTSPTVDTLKRFVTNTNTEAAILDFDYTGGSTALVTLDNTVTGTTATIWDVDVLEEKTVTTGASTTSTLTISGTFSTAPATYANYMFGESTTVKRPYRLRAIHGDGIERRTLTFGEYNELVYSAPETVIPAPEAKPSKIPEHVKNLHFITDMARTSDSVVHGMLTWTADNVFRYGGADVYIAKGTTGEFTFFKSVLATNTVQIDVHQGEQLRFKVVAFNDTSIRAAINTAPVIGYNVVTAAASTTIPTGGSATTDRVNLLATETITWTRNTDATLASRVQLQLAGEATWRDYGITQEARFTFYELPAGNHTARVRSEKGMNVYSDWLNIPFTVAVPTLTAPTILSDGTAVDHTLNADASADISFEWNWAGTESSIDGFEVIVYSSSSSSAYTLGTTPSAENVTLLTPNKRAIIFRGVPANLYYTIYVRAFKRVHSSFAANGVLFSTAVKPSLAAENPYRPTSNIAWNGDIIGTVNVSDINVWSAITGTGKPEDDATFGADWSSNLTNVPANLSALVGTEAILNQEILDSIAADNILSVTEKNSSLKKLAADLEARYLDLFNRATTLGVSTTALTTARTAWKNLLAAYNPKWNDTTQDTSIYAPSFGISVFPDDWTLTNVTTTPNGIYTTVTDSDTGAVGNINNGITQTASATQYSAGIVIKKDSVPASTRQLRLQIEGTGGTFFAGFIGIDTQAGTIVVSSNVDESSIYDLGDEWFAYLSFTTNSANTSVRVRISPAATTGSGGGSGPAITGSVDIRDPVFALGDGKSLGRSSLEGRLAAYSGAMTSLAKAISEKQPVFRGAWVTATSYLVNDIVTSGNTLYQCVTAHTSSTAPPNSNWTKYTPANQDDLTDGTTYVRMPGTNTFGTGTSRRARVDFSDLHLNKILDNISDGSTYGRPLLSRLNAGKPWIDFSEAIHSNKNIDNISDGSTYGRPIISRLNGGKPWIDFQESIHSNKRLSNVLASDENPYNTGTPNLVFNGGLRVTNSSSVPLGWTLDSGWTWNAGNGEGPYLGIAIGGTKVAKSDPINVVAGSTYSLTLDMYGGGITAGAMQTDVQWYSDAAGTTLVLDDGGVNVVNGSGWASYSKTYTAPATAIRARVRVFLSGATNTNAAFRRLKFYLGSAIVPFTDEGTNSHSLLTRSGGDGLDAVIDGATYGRPLVSRLNGGKPWIDFAEAIHSNKNVDNISDGSTYARILSSQLSSGAHKLTVAGSGTTVGDARNLKPISSAGLRYKFTGTISYTSTTTTATISTTAGSLLLGSQTISYNAMSVGTSGSGTVTYYLYVDTNAYTAGAHTLIATTSTTVPYQGDDRVYIGSSTVTYTTSGSGGGDPGGGGGLGCPFAESFVHTKRGWIEAVNVKKGDFVLALSEDMEFANDWVEVEDNTLFFEHCYTITGLISGISVTVSDSTPITLRDGSVIAVADINKHELPFENNGRFWWEECEITDADVLPVCKIKCHQRTYSAGDKPGFGILTHNPKP